AATVRWIDYFYGDEGIKLYLMGIEGETYEINDDGEPELMDHILNSKDGLTIPEELSKNLTSPGDNYHSMTVEKYFNGAEMRPDSLKAAEKLEQNMVENPWPSIRHTKEEIDELRGFGTDIEKYVAEMREKFISGDEPLSKWDDYVNEI